MSSTDQTKKVGIFSSSNGSTHRPRGSQDQDARELITNSA
jgi:hypothetical protein